jgi:hypothetical protein
MAAFIWFCSCHLTFCQSTSSGENSATARQSWLLLVKNRKNREFSVTVEGGERSFLGVTETKHADCAE